MALRDVRQQARIRIEGSLQALAGHSLREGALQLLEALGYQSAKTADFGSTPTAFINQLEQLSPREHAFNREKACVERWRECAFLFQLTDEEIPDLVGGQSRIAIDESLQAERIESFVFLAVDLKNETWSRRELATITRELNHFFPMPAIVLFRHGGLASLAVIQRRLHRRDEARDVLLKVTLIKDLRLAQPHRAHLEILSDLSLPVLAQSDRFLRSFSQLHKAWRNALSVEALNNRFYRELSHWYLWAQREVSFPKGGGLEEEKRNQVALIRLLTRLIFVWFIKERGLVPEAFFDARALRELLIHDPEQDGDAGSYYLAVLQNLFFATLNKEETDGDRRTWADHDPERSYKADRLVTTLYRHQELFRDPGAALEQFRSVPFLNGGLFECLDRELTERDLQHNPELRAQASQEGKGLVLRVDGFTRRPESQPLVPNRVFFSQEQEVDLNEAYGTKGKRYKAKGLLEILHHYKFTVDENTPLDEEVALDPELLGKVFENLLASYNSETRETARKASGSFYTPRDVVDYMVDEALLAIFERALPNDPETETRLRRLLSYQVEGHDLNGELAGRLITLIEDLKVLDPACGSGAFPMGMLNKLVHVLGKLDPDNAGWKAKNRVPLEERLRAARLCPDLSRREAELEEAEEALRRLDESFARGHQADYTRKLYLIEKCLHGVDIQPIAVQIAKLRFFIALVVSQQVDPDRPNQGITALPNLETKIVAANSLVPLQRAGQLVLRNTRIEELERELAETARDHFAARTLRSKRRHRERLAELRDQLAGLFEADGILPAGSSQRLAHWNPFDQNACADFFDPEWMFQQEGGFDIVIGNPPYVRQESILDQKEGLKAAYPEVYAGTSDLYVFFYARAVQLLGPGGVLSFISSNKWYRAKYGEKLRDWLSRQTRLRALLDFGDADVFTAIAYPTIVLAQKRHQPLPAKGNPGPDEQVRALNWMPDWKLEDFAERVARESFGVPQAGLSQEAWQLEPPLKRKLLERLRAAGRPLGEVVGGRFFRGILTGLNEAFVVDRLTRDRLIAEDPNSAEVLKPFLRGRDIKRWRVESNDLWLIKIESSENVEHPWSGLSDREAERVFKQQYPAIHRHFQIQRDAMIARYDQGNHFWELRSCAYWQGFEHPKIIYPDIARSPQFAVDYDNRYVANTAYIIPHGECWLLAVLNSTTCAWFYSQISPQIQNDYQRFTAQYCEQIPIPAIDEHRSALLDVVVTAVATTTTSHFEPLINGLVYELFFPDELTAAGILLFSTCEACGLPALAPLKDAALAESAREWAARHLAPGQPLAGMLEKLKDVEVVRIIEGDLAPRPPAKAKAKLQDHLLPRLQQEAPYVSHARLVQELTRGATGAKASTVAGYLVDMVGSGQLFDAGRGWYSFLSQAARLEADLLQPLLADVRARFPLLPHAAWSTAQLNPWLHHLVGQETLFLCLPSDALDTVAGALEDAGWRALANPRGEAARRFAPKPQTVVLRALHSAAPPAADGAASVEQVLVDLCFEMEDLALLSAAEFRAMATRLASENRINVAAFLNYARKRQRSPREIVENQLAATFEKVADDGFGNES